MNEDELELNAGETIEIIREVKSQLLSLIKRLQWNSNNQNKQGINALLAEAAWDPNLNIVC